MKLPDDFIFIKEDTVFRILKYANNNYDLFGWDWCEWMIKKDKVSTKAARKYYDESINVYVRKGLTHEH
jgi:hypothetical protein